MTDRQKNRQSAIASLIAALAILALSLAPAVASADSPPFCGEQIVHDYTRPFQRMPRLHEPPKSGHFPFAPPRVYLQSPERSVLVSEDGMGPVFSYGLSSTSSIERTIRLDWVMVARVFRVDGRGRPVEVVNRRSRAIGTVSDKELSRISLPLWLSSKESLYKVELSIMGRHGALLGRYGQYLRVVRPTVAVGLGLNSKSLRPGAALDFRVENFGTARVSYGEPFSIERFDGVWSVYLSEAQLGPWHRNLLGLFSGAVGRCQRVRIPADAPPGKYRLRKALVRPSVSLSKEFSVAPG